MLWIFLALVPPERPASLLLLSTIFWPARPPALPIWLWSRISVLTLAWCGWNPVWDTLPPTCGPLWGREEPETNGWVQHFFPSCVEGQASCFLVSLVQRMVAFLEKGSWGGWVIETSAVRSRS